jgi:hypothetical protein
MDAAPKLLAAHVFAGSLSLQKSVGQMWALTCAFLRPPRPHADIQVVIFLALIVFGTGLLVALDAERMAEVTQQRLATTSVGWLILPNPPRTASQWKACAYACMAVGALLALIGLRAVLPLHLMNPLLAFLGVLLALHGGSIAISPRRRPDIASWDIWLIGSRSDPTQLDYGWSLFYRRVLIAYFKAIGRREFGAALLAIAATLLFISI